MTSIADQNKLGHMEVEIAALKNEVRVLREEMDALKNKRGPGRPRKEDKDAEAHQG